MFRDFSLQRVTPVCGSGKETPRATLAGLFAGAVLFALMPMAAAENDPVQIQLSAYAIDIDEDGAEVLRPATKVNPGDLIEYDLDYKNVSADPLEGFVVLGDVPTATSFVNVSAVEGIDAVMEVLVEDIGWSLEPVVRYVKNEQGAMMPKEVSPAEYNALRWRLIGALPPGEEISVSYRVRVEK